MLGPKNFKAENITRAYSMSVAKPPKEFLNIPEGVDIFPYGNQKLNVWEF
jgi:hypothetical protein